MATVAVYSLMVASGLASFPCIDAAGIASERFPARRLRGTTPDEIKAKPIKTNEEGRDLNEDPTAQVTAAHRRLQTQQQCNIALSIGDSNRDDRLNRDPEYVRFLNQLTRNANNYQSFATLPPALQQNFETLAGGEITWNIAGSKPGQSGNDEFLQRVCGETKAAIDSVVDAPATSAPPPQLPLPPPPPPLGRPKDCSEAILRPQCFTAIAIADLNRDDWLDQSEFVRFVNRVSKGAVATLPDFNSLSAPVRAVFSKFADTFNNNRIDVTGSKPGQTPTAEQDVALSALCCETDLAWQSTGPTAPPVGGPPSFPSNVCRTAMASSDFNRDDYLNESEFVRYLNRLTQNRFQGTSFDSLEQVLQDLYTRLAKAANGINIAGSKPGQSPGTVQSQFLDQFCQDTANALNGGSPPVEAPMESPVEPPVVVPTEPPLTVPTPPPNPAFVVQPALCRTAMASSDFNRDDQLSQSEFVRFLNRLTRNAFLGVTFDQLDDSFRLVFSKLSNGSGQISIRGSKPGQDTTEDQRVFLETICATASSAIADVLYAPTAAPTENVTQAPSVMSSIEEGVPTLAPSWVPIVAPTGPTLPPNIIKVASSFIITNSLGIKASGLEKGANRDGLERAYLFFAEAAAQKLEEDAEEYFASRDVDATGTNTTESVGNVTGAASRSLRGGPRRLAVTIQPNTANLYYLVDSGCPESVTEVNALCQTVFGDFRVRDDDVTEENFRERTDVFVNITQGFISRGRLQEALDERDSRSILTIVDASFPVTTVLPPSASPPSDGPGGQPTEEGGSGEEEGYSIAQKIAGITLCALVVFIAAFFFCRGSKPPPKKQGKRKKKKTKNSGKKTPAKKTSSADSKQDDDAPGTEFGDDTVSGFGETQSEINEFGDDDGDDKKDGKKKWFKGKEKADKNEFGDDVGDVNAFGDDDGSSKQGSIGLANYGFDDSSINREVAEKQEAGSLLDNDDDNAFGASTSPKRPSARHNAFGDDEEDDEDDPNKHFFGSATNSPGWGAKDSVESVETEFFNDNQFGHKADEDDDDMGAMSTQSDLISKDSESDSDSYTSSDDSTYESRSQGEEFSTGSGTFANSSRPGRSTGASVISESSPGSMPVSLQKKSDDMDEMIRSGNWDGIAAVANTFASEDSSIADNSRYKPPSNRSKSRQSLGSVDEEASYSESGRSKEDNDRRAVGEEDDDGSSSDGETTATSMRTEAREKRAEYRAQVEALVKMVVPDEIGKVDAMMEQFRGREAELVATLQTMQERSASQRARAAIHRSKTRPTRPERGFRSDAAYSMQSSQMGTSDGAAARTAAIAAASIPVPADDMYGDEDDMDQGSYGDEGGSQNGEDSFQGDSYHDGASYNDQSYGRSPNDRSYGRSPNDQSYERSPNDRSSLGYGSYDQSYNDRSHDEKSYVDQDRSYNDPNGSYRDENGSYGDEDGSYRDEDRSFNDQDHSYNDQDGSYNDDDRSYSEQGGSFYNDGDSKRDKDVSYRDDRSYNDDDDDDRSFADGSERSGHGGASFNDASYNEGEGSYNDGGSYYDDDGSRSGSESGSHSDGDYSRGRYDDDDRSYDSRSEVSRSEASGSYFSDKR